MTITSFPSTLLNFLEKGFGKQMSEAEMVMNFAILSEFKTILCYECVKEAE
jgi:hypothetical protein